MVNFYKVDPIRTSRVASRRLFSSPCLVFHHVTCGLVIVLLNLGLGRQFIVQFGAVVPNVHAVSVALLVDVADTLVERNELVLAVERHLVAAHFLRQKSHGDDDSGKKTKAYHLSIH